MFSLFSYFHYDYFHKVDVARAVQFLAARPSKVSVIMIMCVYVIIVIIISIIVIVIMLLLLLLFYC